METVFWFFLGMVVGELLSLMIAVGVGHYLDRREHDS